MSTSENTRNGTTSNAFVYTNTKMSLSRGHFETSLGETLRPSERNTHPDRIIDRGGERPIGKSWEVQASGTHTKTHTTPEGGCKKNDKGRTGESKHGRELKEPEEVYPRAKLLTEIRSDRPQKRASSIYRGGTERRELSN